MGAKETTPALDERRRAEGAKGAGAPSPGAAVSPPPDWARAVDSLSDAICIVQWDGTILRANAAALRVLGLPEEMVIGRPCYELFHGRETHHPECPLARMRETGRREESELKLDRRWCRVTVEPFPDSGPQTQLAVHVVRDIHRERRARERLAQREHEQRFVLDNLVDLVAVFGADRRLQFISESYARLFGRPAEELLGEDFIQLIHPADREQTRERIAGLFEPPYHSTHEERVASANGYRIVQWSARGIPDATGAVTAVVAVGRDVTEEKELHAERLRRTRLDSLALVAGGIAHEYNNLLTGIAGHVGLASDLTAEDDPRRAHLLEIERAVGRAAAVTRHLLAFGRRQEGRFTQVDMGQVIENLRRDYERTATEEMRAGFLVPPQGVVGTVRADAEQAADAIREVLCNAVEAQPAGGRIEVRLYDTVLDEKYCQLQPGASPGRYVVVGIRDWGEGLSAVVREKAFEPFFTTRDPTKHRGLGLARVYGILRQHEGFVSLESVPGRGTTVRLHFPASARELREETPLLPSGPPSSSPIVLVVEDDPVVRELNVRALESNDLVVLSAGDGEEALDLALPRIREIGVVVSDVLMPRMDGVTMARKLREVRPDLRIIFTSGYSGRLSQNALDELGAGFLGKPYRLEALIAEVRRRLPPGETTPP